MPSNCRSTRRFVEVEVEVKVNRPGSELKADKLLYIVARIKRMLYLIILAVGR